MTRQTLSVRGMSCSGCESTVESALEELAAVDSATADHESDTVEVVVGDSSPDLHAAIEDAGYEVTD